MLLDVNCSNPKLSDQFYWLSTAIQQPINPIISPIPMTFAQIIGQSATANRLLRMVQQNRLSHALLFLGKEGSGALSLAFAFAQYLVCEKVNGKSKHVENNAPSLFGEPEPSTAAVNKGWPADACNNRAACLKAAKLIHPDSHYWCAVSPRK